MSTEIRAAIHALNKFSIISENTEGANSYAFVAKHLHLNEKRFLKVIYLPDQETDLVLKEPRTLLAALNAKPGSPNLVRIFDAELLKVDTDTYVLLQMENISGPSLQSAIENRVFGQQEAVRLVIGLLHGVAHLHRQRILHRDLKPGNILLDEAVTKIADFGSVARVVEGHEFVNASKHSDLYVPPEGWGTPRRYTFASDVYQCGLVLDQLINGPFETSGKRYLTNAVLKRLRDKGMDYGEMHPMDKALVERECFAELTRKNKLIETARVSRPYLSGALRRLIATATHADLNTRFSSAEAFMKKLTSISVPDWLPIKDGFEARSWKKWDWRVLTEAKRFSVQKARTMSGKFRRVETFTTLSDAFEFVDRHKD